MVSRRWSHCVRAAAALCVLALGAVACDSGGDEGGEPVDDDSVQATVGAKGGVLDGRAGSSLFGVKVLFPPGALTGNTKVTLKPTFDATPLPEYAERVGPQVVIESKGTLSGPMLLTLPVDSGAVDRFGQGATSVKVWLRAGGTWALTEPTETGEGTVTISLSEFTTAAAGVKVTSLVPKCAGAGACTGTAASHYDAVGCASTGLCARAMFPAGQPIDGFDFAVAERGTALAFPAPAATTGIKGASLGVQAGSSAFGPSRTLTSSRRVNPGLVGAGDVMVGLASGNLLLPADSRAPVLYTDGVGLGGFRISSGQSLRFAIDPKGDLGVINHEEGLLAVDEQIMVIAVNNVIAVSHENAPRIVPLRGDAGFLVGLASQVLEAKLTSEIKGSVTQTVQLPKGQSLSPQAPLASGPAGAVAAVSQPGAKVVVSRGGAAFQVVSGVAFPASSVAFDGTGAVVISSATTPEIMVVQANGQARSFRLTDAPEGSAAATNAIIRQIVSASGDARLPVAGIVSPRGDVAATLEVGLIALTQDRSFVRLTLP
ncbi:MAG: hypothetical protein R3F39_09105 [Myxococcota bacterium]